MSPVKPVAPCVAGAGSKPGSNTQLLALRCCQWLSTKHGYRRKAQLRCAAVASSKPASDAETAEPATSGASSSSKKAGRMTYRASTFGVLVRDSAEAVLAAIADGNKLLEVEFPGVPSQLDGYKGASDMFIDANVQLALAAARVMVEAGKKVRLLLPDEAEYARSSKMFRTTVDMSEGSISMGHLNEAGRSMVMGLKALFGGDSEAVGEVPAGAEAADVFIVVNVSAVELPDVERYYSSVVKDRVMVTWNCELDTLRADLGLLGFPPKDLQHRFLCKFRPAFYIRPRDYSKSVAVAPFIINYSGCLFREYPGPWQVMIRQDSGEYACIAEDSNRYTLGQVKEELMRVMGLDTEEAGSAMAFLRRGYKTSTWWEDDTDKEVSNLWRL